MMLGVTMDMVHVPVSTASDVTPQLSSTSIMPAASTPLKRVQIEPIDTWKGLIGIKEKTVIIPQEYSSYTWVTDLSECATFENKLKETFRTISTTANAENDTEKRTRIQSFITDEEQDLQRNNLQILENSLTDTPATLPTETPQACETYPSPSIGHEICSDLNQDLTLLQDNLVEALSSEDSSRNGGLSSIMNLHQSYQNNLKIFRETLMLIRKGEIPAELLSLVNANCNVLYRQCSKPQVNHKDLAFYSTLIKILSFGKSTGHKVFVTIGTPCISSEDIIHQRRLIAMPYKKNDKFMKISLHAEHSRIWQLQPNATSKTLVHQPWGCKEISYELTACPPQTIRPLTAPIEKNMVEEALGTVSTEILALDTQTIISTPAEITLVSQCNNQPPEEHKIQGLNYITNKDACNLKIQETNQTITTQGRNNILSGSDLQNALQLLTQGINNIISINDNDFGIKDSIELAADIIPQLVDIIDVTAHFEQNWIYYAWTTTILLAIGITFFIYWMCLTQKEKRQRLRFKRKRTRTYVLPRTNTLTA